jgi:hypothetical protein
VSLSEAREVLSAMAVAAEVQSERARDRMKASRPTEADSRFMVTNYRDALYNQVAHAKKRVVEALKVKPLATGTKKSRRLLKLLDQSLDYVKEKYPPLPTTREAVASATEHELEWVLESAYEERLWG